MKPYRLKHKPSGLYWQPCKHRGSHLSRNGKIYQTATNGLSSAFKRAEKNPDYLPYLNVEVETQRDSQIHKLLSDWNWQERRHSKYRLVALTKLTDWEREEL